MKYQKKLSPEGDSGATPNSSEEKSEKVDVGQLRKEILDSNKQMVETLYSNVMESVKTVLTSHEEGKKQAEEEVERKGSGMQNLHEFNDEFAALGIKDEEQAEALLKVVDKILQKNASGFEKKILNTVTTQQTEKDRKAQFQAEVKEKYPDILNRNSALFAETQRIWNDEMEQSQRDAPSGTRSAVVQAAVNLGIQPISRQDMYENMNNPTGSGSGNTLTKNKQNEPAQKAVDFAQHFGIKKDLFSAKLKEIQARSH